MSGGNAGASAASAWRILKRNGRYDVQWWTAAAGITQAGGEPFPIRVQTDADLEAAEWACSRGVGF